MAGRRASAQLPDQLALGPGKARITLGHHQHAVLVPAGTLRRLSVEWRRLVAAEAAPQVTHRRQLMQEEAVSDQVDEAVVVPRVVREPYKLQVELAQEHLLRCYGRSEGRAPAPGDLLEVLGRGPYCCRRWATISAA